jgi:outer membrane lipoprotein LolB
VTRQLPSLRRLLLAAALAGLAGCTTLKTEQVDGESLSGRLSVKVEATETTAANSLSAGFDLQGSPERGQLNLSSPLGQVLAQAKWSADQAQLTTTDGEKTFPTLDALTQEMLGEALPVAALFDWLRGRPWAQAPSEPADPDGPAGFRQLGWQVDTSRLPEGWVTARRPQPPVVTVRARVDP